MSFLKEYTLLGELGKGGFAKVYKVRHNELGYIRAIRVLNEPITDENSKTYQKFLHECKVLLRLGNGSHRSIVHIYQPRLLDNHALVEMDYVDGQDITHYLKENGNYLPIEEVLRMVEEMSNALAYCHEDIYQFCMDPDEDDLRNDPVDGNKWLIDEATKQRLVEKYKVIHNDIHSGNIMRRKDGSFVLLDFGLAIEGDEVVKSSSRHENGAPEYMPPEKWDNETVLTEQSDIYSFGIVMYEYLAGRVPFVCEGNSFNARTKLYEQIKNSTSLPSIVDLRKSFFEEKYKGKAYKKDYPEWLETAIMKCLEKDPAKRFRNGKELNEFILRHLREEIITKESVQSLTDEIASLKDERQQALAQIADLTRKNDDLERLEKQLDETFQEKKDLEDEVEKLKKKPGGKSKPLPIVLCVLLGIAAVVLGILYFTRTPEAGGIPVNPDSVEKELADLKTENADLKKNNADLEKEITSLKKTVNDLKNSKQSQSTREKELETQLDQANSTISGLEKERDDLKNERDNLKNERDNLKNERDNLKSERDNLKNERDNLKNERDNLKSERDNLRKERDNLKKERDNLKKECDNLKNEIKVLNENF